MILQKIRDSIINNDKITKNQLVIRGLWSVDCLFKPNMNERTFNYKFIVAQTIGQGCAYSIIKNYNVGYLESLMGKRYDEIKIDDVALEVAIIDSIYSTLQRNPDRQIELNGTSVEKAESRAKIVVEEALRLLDKNNLKSSKPLVCNIGVVGNIIKELIDKDMQVIGADFDKEIIGTKLFNSAEIIHGENASELIAQSDIAIVTGMTLTTGTLDDIIATAKKFKTRLVIFAETGSNLGSIYVENGVDCVIGEPFPFYIFQGKTALNIFTKDTPRMP